MTREEAIELLSNDAFKLCMVQLRDPLFEDCYEALCMAIDALEQESKRGKWIKATGMMPPEFHGHHYCSECGNFANMEPPLGNREDLSKYCPNCGKGMESDTDGSD